ncbi:MAG: transcriptional regulator NrdR [Phycisphaerales bacterium]|nr:transcriptional regulator NrdR [Phycisphaerales bacterium]
MRCPYCELDDDKVIDSRPADDAASIRRRRECLSCKRRFTTYERIEKTARLVVVKKDGSRVPFNGENLLRGIRAACGKRPIPEDTKEAIVRAVEDELQREFEKEVPSMEVGRRVADALREVDHIAYVRYASEYLEFRNLDELTETVNELKSRPQTLPNQERLFE